MDSSNDILYHLCCPSCGADWWDKNAFPSCCPYCNTNRMQERKENNIKENIKDKVVAYLFGCAIGLAITYGVIIPALNSAI